MHYAVLDGISPDYPAVAGRLHTCYSPVRRSPAGEGKPSPPLPLDLHVLSLSLAFILSQDQTLRCYIILSFSFLFCKTAEPETSFPGHRYGFVRRIDRVIFFRVTLVLLSCLL